MVTLHCGVFGDASVFEMEVAYHTRVLDAREAIFNKKLYNGVFWFDESALRLFIAKTADGKWLRSGVALTALLKQGLQNDEEFVEMDPFLPLDAETNLGPRFPQGSNELHVLIKLPPEPKSTLDPRCLDVHELLLYHVLIEAPSSSTTSPSDYFKERLVETYKCQCPDPPFIATSPTSTVKTLTKGKHNRNGKQDCKKLRCMLLDMPLPSELVSATYLFRRSNEFMVEPFMRFRNVDDAKNGLLLFEPVKQALDRFEICFLYDIGVDEYRLKIFNAEIRPQRLIDSLGKRQREALLSSANLPLAQG